MDLLVDDGIGLAEHGAALAVADDDVLHAEVAQHGGADFAGVSTVILIEKILCADGHAAVLKGAHGGGNVHARHAHDHVAPLGLGQQSLEIVRKLFGLGGGLVHFPVSGNDGFAISAIHGKCSPKYIKCFLKTLLIQQAGDARQHPPWGCP